MAMRHGRQRDNYRRIASQNSYIEGNTVRKLDVRRAIEEEPRHSLNPATRKNREKARHMNLSYVAFLLIAAFVTGFILINYIQLRADITNSSQQIAAMESSLNSLIQENDEKESRLMSSVDLEEVKRIAIGELGMTYATKEQIMIYTNDDSDYVRQYADVPR